MTEPRAAVARILTPHAGEPKIADILRYLVSDQAASFYTAPFHRKPNSRFADAGGLVAAMGAGYQALRILERTSHTLYSPVSIDRLVLVYSLIMLGRWADLRTGTLVYDRVQGSMTTVAISNALVLGVGDLTAAEIQALTCWPHSRQEMLRIHEPFNVQWWAIHQTMEFLFVVSAT